MDFRGADPLLIATMAALAAVSLYASWLWLNLWFTNQVLSRIAVISPSREGNDSQPGCGCGGILIALLAVAAAIVILLTVS